MNDSVPSGNLNQCSCLDIFKGTGKLGACTKFLWKWRTIQTIYLLDQISLISRESFRHFRLKCIPLYHKSNWCTNVKVAMATVGVWDSSGERWKPMSGGEMVISGIRWLQKGLCLLPWPCHGLGLQWSTVFPKHLYKFVQGDENLPNIQTTRIRYKEKACSNVTMPSKATQKPFKTERLLG